MFYLHIQGWMCLKHLAQFAVDIAGMSEDRWVPLRYEKVYDGQSKTRSYSMEMPGMWQS